MLSRPIDAQWDLRGTNQQWFHSDLEWWFDKNQPEGWTKDCIEYRFNAEGFRMNCDLSQCKSGADLYIGDSHTFGLGVNLEDTWTYKHHQIHGHGEFINLGVSGGCLDTVTRLLAAWLPELEPSRVFILEPAPYRSEFLLENEIFVSGSWTTLAARRLAGAKKTDELVFQDKLFTDYVSPEAQQQVNRAKNIAAIRHLCEDYNLSYASHFPITDEYLKQGRDGFHAGPDQHDLILDWFVGVEESSPLPSFR